MEQLKENLEEKKDINSEIINENNNNNDSINKENPFKILKENINVNQE